MNQLDKAQGPGPWKLSFMHNGYSRVLAAAVAVLIGATLAACGSQEEKTWDAPAPAQRPPAGVASPVAAATAPISPLVPTLVPAPEPVAPSTEITLTPTALSEAAGETLPAASAAPTGQLPLELRNLRSRLGVGAPAGVGEIVFTPELAGRLGVGWYLDWNTTASPVEADGVEYAQLYTMHGANIPLRRDYLAQVLAANPGALWLAGNEPDVIWQDNQSPEAYARLYHEFYTFIKTLDPSAQVAIAGVSQVTPLRLAYLEEVLAAYQRLYGQPMPVDVWNVHAFILREERESWGVSIPPGFDVDQGVLWEIDDHDDLSLFQQQIVDFRRWMVKHGQRDKPLIVSEFGILMPEEYGFPPDRVARFMTEAFDFLLNATDQDLGYPADDNRLVQRLAWYSLGDTVYPTGNLVDPQTGELTVLGQAFAGYAAELD